MHFDARQRNSSICIQVAQPFGQHYIDPPRQGIDPRANVCGQRNQHFSLGSFHFQERRSGKFFSRKLNVTHGAKQGGRFHERARRGRKGRRCGRVIEHGTANQVRNEILSCRQRSPSFERKQHSQPAKLLRLRNRIYAFEVKNGLPAMILAQPALLQRDTPRLILAVRNAHKYFLQFSEPFRKISKEFSSNFTFIASRTKNARDQYPSLSFGFQWTV